MTDEPSREPSKPASVTVVWDRFLDRMEQLFGRHPLMMTAQQRNGLREWLQRQGMVEMSKFITEDNRCTVTFIDDWHAAEFALRYK